MLLFKLFKVSSPPKPTLYDYNILGGDGAADGGQRRREQQREHRRARPERQEVLGGKHKNIESANKHVGMRFPLQKRVLQLQVLPSCAPGQSLLPGEIDEVPTCDVSSAAMVNGATTSCSSNGPQKISALGYAPTSTNSINKLSTVPCVGVDMESVQSSIQGSSGISPVPAFVTGAAQMKAEEHQGCDLGRDECCCLNFFQAFMRTTATP